MWGAERQPCNAATRSSSKARFPGNWENRWKFARSCALERGRGAPDAGSSPGPHAKPAEAGLRLAALRQPSAPAPPAKNNQGRPARLGRRAGAKPTPRPGVCGRPPTAARGFPDGRASRTPLAPERPTTPGSEPGEAPGLTPSRRAQGRCAGALSPPRPQPRAGTPLLPASRRPARDCRGEAWSPALGCSLLLRLRFSATSGAGLD